MRKTEIVHKDEYIFDYNSYDSLIKNTEVLHNSGFIVDFCEEISIDTWRAYARIIDDDAKLNGTIFYIYESSGNIIYKGFNDYKTIKKYKRNNSVNELSNLNKSELKEYLYNMEYKLEESKQKSIELLNQDETKNLIDVLLDSPVLDKAYLKELSEHLEKISKCKY